MKVPYLLEPAIERDAEVLLAQFCGARGVELSAPIPVEEILEQHLGLSLGFDDLHARFDVPQMDEEPDVLGALFVDRREVLINQVLDPEDHPFQEGRYRYTLGHEIGHWELHRELVSAAAGAPTLFGRAAAAPIICRRSQAREPIEWQADTYSAHLLMLIRCPRARKPRSPDRQPREIRSSPSSRLFGHLRGVKGRTHDAVFTLLGGHQHCVCGWTSVQRQR